MSNIFPSMANIFCLPNDSIHQGKSLNSYFHIRRLDILGGICLWTGTDLQGIRYSLTCLQDSWGSWDHIINRLRLMETFPKGILSSIFSDRRFGAGILGRSDSLHNDSDGKDMFCRANCKEYNRFYWLLWWFLEGIPCSSGTGKEWNCFNTIGRLLHFNNEHSLKYT